METLIKKNNLKRWYPYSVDRFKSGILIPLDTEDNKRYNSNFAYSMQYLQYIEKQLNELDLSSVLITMLYKNYIITGMSIIEMLFTYILKKTGNWNMSEWEEIQTFKSNPCNNGTKQFHTETKLFMKVEEYEMRMDLDSMIKRIEKKHLLSIDHSAFPALKKLRELRNKVHIQTGDSAYDHDYNAFNYEEVKMMKKILYVILTSPEICKDKNVFDFIKIND